MPITGESPILSGAYLAAIRKSSWPRSAIARRSCPKGTPSLSAKTLRWRLNDPFDPIRHMDLTRIRGRYYLQRGSRNLMVSNSESRRVAIFTALPLECMAVCQHLASRSQTTHPQGTIYERGLFAAGNGDKWDVVVVECGAGNITTALEVERSISFFQPEIMLFVGIAGGLKDVSIGDVVVGTKVYAYESGKEKEAFESRPETHVPSYRRMQRAKAEIRSGLWVKRIRARIASGVPKAFAGAIAAGEKVIASKSSASHVLLKERYADALAVEMEGYGFLRGAYLNPNVAALVIRGISDLIDAKSSADAEGSQERAAEAASAFAFELLAHFEGEVTRPRIYEQPSASVRRRFEPDPRIERLIKNVKLGGWKEAAIAALKIIETTDTASGRNELFEALFAYQDLEEDNDRFWGALHTLESCVRIAPWLITREQFSRLACHASFSVRSSAASICMDLAHSAAALVPIDIAIKLSVWDEDWYVETPANAALKAMAKSFPEILGIFFMRLRSRSADEREHAAQQIKSIADKEPHLLDPDQLAAELVRLRRLDDPEASRLLEAALLNAKASPRREWYRYGL